MTINPKVKIVGGVALAAAGAYEIKNAIKATDKKKKIIHGIAGAALILSGFFVGKKGVVQVMGLSVQNKKIDDTNNPAHAIASDLSAQNADKKASQTQNFSGKKKDTSIIKDSFSQILNSSAGGGSGQVMEKSQARQAPPNNVIVKHQDSRTNGANSPNRVSPIEIEKGKLRKKAITDAIAAKEAEHKKIAKDKNRGWNDDSARKLRNDISLLKAQLFYV